MDTKKIIVAIGAAESGKARVSEGVKALTKLSGLTRGRIYQWISEEKIPTPWLIALEASYPKLDWDEFLSRPKPEKKTRHRTAASHPH